VVLSVVQAKPFVKWAGGKTQLLKEIRKNYPCKIEKYCEPFVGGGAVLFDVLNRYAPKEVLINDINKELINVYWQVKHNCPLLVENLSALQTLYDSMSPEERKTMFYEKRKRYNEISVSQLGEESPDNIAEYNLRECNLEKATLFIFLNKTCFNGLYRVSAKGLFNVPYNSAKKPLLCDSENLLKCSAVLQNVEMKAGNYKNCKTFIDAKTFVYIDPPYRPLSKTSSFTAYSSRGFDDKEHIELKYFVDEIVSKGALILLSNSDPKNADANDEFFDSLYSNFDITRVAATRIINRNAKGRSVISELLISNIGRLILD